MVAQYMWGQCTGGPLGGHPSCFYRPIIIVLVVAWRGSSERAFRAVEGVRRSVFCWLPWPCISLTVTSYNALYTPVCTFIYNANHNSHPTRAWRSAYQAHFSHSHACVSFTLSCVKCLLPQHPHNSPLRPASPRLLRRAIPRQSLASHGDATSRRRGSNFPHPHFKGVEPQRLQNFWDPSYMSAQTVWPRAKISGMITYVGSSVFLGSVYFFQNPKTWLLTFLLFCCIRFFEQCLEVYQIASLYTVRFETTNITYTYDTLLIKIWP